MKNVLYLCLLLPCCVNAQASSQQEPIRPAFSQSFDRGNWQFTARGGYLRGILFRNRINAQLNAGYFVADKLLLGVSGLYTREWFGKAGYQTLGAGPMVHWQITRTRVSPFVELSYQFERRTLTSPGVTRQEPGLQRSALFMPGLSIGLSPALRAELSYGFQYNVRTLSDGFSSRRYKGYYIHPQFGLSYTVARKRG
ncbi:hypothetical protein DYU11_27300 [Fibrisoma montanum]|uniref:Outer membrane protein beta-barrel domain-containing protein n=1 Tax=Fibrisoma montanum TaxID=2305895 RepID=A0A418LZJ2_9BACT|nr:hypothetical protein [Fibrisoma montanum]RIV18679.1 hypothetical protein DYU11_27300 [Fibrisoma montanum]